MIARIEFEVENEEEFELQKQVAQLPGETWTLLLSSVPKESKNE